MIACDGYGHLTLANRPARVPVLMRALSGEILHDVEVVVIPAPGDRRTVLTNRRRPSSTPTATRLRTLGCEYAQDYLLARPHWPEGIYDLLADEALASWESHRSAGTSSRQVTGGRYRPARFSSPTTPPTSVSLPN